jgi:hypothetical protein
MESTSAYFYSFSIRRFKPHVQQLQPNQKKMKRLADGKITYARAEAVGLNTTNTPSKAWSANPNPDLDYGLRFAG